MTNRIDDILVKFFNEAVKDLNANDLKDGVLITKSHTKAKAQLQTLIEQMMNEVIGAPLEVDVSWRPTIEDPYGVYQMNNQTTTPKMITSAESYQTIRQQYQRIPTIVAQYFGGEK